jgi:hypothetical protein
MGNEEEPSNLASQADSSHFEDVVLLINNVVLMVICFVLMIFYFVLFVHIKRGNNNKWLMFVSALLVASNLLTVSKVYFAAKLFRGGTEDVNEFNIVGMCFGNSGASLFFNYAHILLAYKYRNIQRTVPYRLKEQEPPPETKTQRVIYYMLMTICFLGPAIQFPASIWFRNTLLSVGEKEVTPF